MAEPVALHLAEVDSTNLEALRRAFAGEAGPLWIRADRQTQGRGRQGREWVSDTGNLYCTLLLTLGLEASKAAGLGFVAALALADTARALAPAVKVSLKWPNDLLLNGAKAAGILIETELRGSRVTAAIGMGLNLAHAPSSTRYPATSIKALGIEITPAVAFQTLTANFTRRLAQWEEGRGFASIRADWLALAHALGETISLDMGAEAITGRFTGIADDGAILLTLPNGTSRILHAGDVRSTIQPGNGQPIGDRS